MDTLSDEWLVLNLPAFLYEFISKLLIPGIKDVLDLIIPFRDDLDVRSIIITHCETFFLLYENLLCVMHLYLLQSDHLV